MLIVEVGESEKALTALLPELPFNWIEFNVGQMGVFLLDRDDLVAHADAINTRRERATIVVPSSRRKPGPSDFSALRQAGFRLSPE